MVKLNNIYMGAQDKYAVDSIRNTYETKYIQTKSTTLRRTYKEIVEETPQELVDAVESLRGNPFSAEARIILDKYKGYTPSKKIVKADTVVDLSIDTTDKSNYGVTGVRFTGNPSAIRSIELLIGGQRIDKIYPSFTGHFDSIHAFDCVIPKLMFHTVKLIVRFESDSDADAELLVDWDVVEILEEIENTELYYLSTQFCGDEHRKAGESTIQLNYNHPVEEIAIYCAHPVESLTLVLDDKHTFHIPYRGERNGKLMYTYTFQRPVNFSRIDKAIVKICSPTDNCISPFAKSRNILRFMKGMAGMAFSK